MNLSKGSIFMVVAGLMGLLATFVVHHYISTRAQAVSKPTTEQLVVAAANIPPGAILGRAQLKIVPFTRESVPPQAIGDLKEAESRVAIKSISAGEPILQTSLAPKGTPPGLGALLPSGKRAFSVRVDDVSGVAGFLHPGDHVDILVEMALPNSRDEHISKTILQDITVLTAGQMWQQVRDEKPVLVNSVTLALTTQESEILNLASNEGKIRLALRNQNDRVSVPTKGVATSSLLSHGSPVQQDVPKSPKTEENNRGVEVIKGLNRSQVNL